MPSGPKHGGSSDQARQAVMHTAWQAHPERCTQHQLLKALQLPEAAWIIQPTPQEPDDYDLAA